MFEQIFESHFMKKILSERVLQRFKITNNLICSGIKTRGLVPVMDVIQIMYGPLL